MPPLATPDSQIRASASPLSAPRRARIIRPGGPDIVPGRLESGAAATAEAVDALVRDGALRAAAMAATPGPYRLCHHLRSAADDASCNCGYRGGIWSGDGERILFEMGGSPNHLGDKCTPEAPRAQQLADARFIAECSPEIVTALTDRVASLLEEVAQLRAQAGPSRGVV